MPPGETSPNIMLSIGAMPPSGVNESCMQFTDPFEVPVVAAGAQAARRRRRSAPPCPPCSRRSATAETDWSTPSVGQRAGCRWSRPTIVQRAHHHEEADHHRHQQPRLAPVADEDAERDDQRERDHQHRPHLEQVREAVRVLERVGRVGVVEAAAVGAELLDRDLRRDRAAGDRLLGGADHLGRRRVDQRRRGAAARFCTTPCDTSTSANRNDIGSRIRTVPRMRSTQKLPSVAVGVRAGDAADDRDDHGEADRRPTRSSARRGRASGVRWLIATSPEYHCQFVLVTKLTATLNAPVGRHAVAIGRVERQRALQPQQRVQRRAATPARTRAATARRRSSAARVGGRRASPGRCAARAGRKTRSPGAEPSRARSVHGGDVATEGRHGDRRAAPTSAAIWSTSCHDIRSAPGKMSTTTR